MATACNAQCPVRLAAEVIESKWTTLIIRDLLSGPKRYHELQTSLHGISSKVLAARLRFLLKKQMIERTVYPTVPPSTEYHLTELGQQFKPVLEAMATFGQLL